MKRALVGLLLLPLLLVGCENGANTTANETNAACAVNRNDEVRQRLAPTCLACHGATNNHPFFVSVRSFEDLLVYDPRYVVPGKPDESRLVQLLEGHADGTYKQMPPGKALAERPEAKISVAEVRDWIAHLPPPGPNVAAADRTAATVRRLTAEEMVTTLRRLLGLRENDVASTNDVVLALRAPDAAWRKNEDSGNIHAAMSRFEALGGPNTIDYRPREHDFTPATMQVLVQVSLEWCGRAVSLPGNAALFKYGGPSEKDPAAIKKNIGYLHLRFLGLPANDQVIEAIHSKVYAKYDADPAIAWTAVCAYFVRHPQTLTL